MIFVTVCRTLFYQFFVLFIGLSIGFIVNAEYIGWKSNLIARSYTNIFHPVEFNENVCQNVKQWGATRIWAELGRPQTFEILEDGLLAEEYYVGKFKYVDVDSGEIIIKIISHRVLWKPWEYYWDDPTPTTEEELLDYLENGTVNSKESDKAYKLYQEKRLQDLKEKEKDEKKNVSAGLRVYTRVIL